MEDILMSNLNQFTGGLLKFNKNQIIGFNENSVQSAAFATDTVAIIVSVKGSDIGGYITIGSNPTASTADFFVKGHNTNGENYPNGEPFGPIGVTAGHKLAVIGADSSGQSIYVMELKY